MQLCSAIKLCVWSGFMVLSRLPWAAVLKLLSHIYYDLVVFVVIKIVIPLFSVIISALLVPPPSHLSSQNVISRQCNIPHTQLY